MLKVKKYVLVLAGITILWSNSALTMEPQSEIAEITLLTKQLKLITSIKPVVTGILKEMKEAAQNIEKSAKNRRRKINALKNTADKKIKDIEKLITVTAAINQLTDLEKSIQERYERSLKQQAQLRVDRILKAMNKITSIESLEQAKKDAEKLVADAKEKIKTTTRLEKLKKLREKIEENYEIQWLDIETDQKNIGSLSDKMDMLAKATDDPEKRINEMEKIISSFNAHIADFDKKLKTLAGREHLNGLKEIIEKNTEESVKILGKGEIKKILTKMDATLVKQYQGMDLDDIKKEAENVVAPLEKLMKKFAYPLKPVEQRFASLLEIIHKKYEEVKTKAEDAIMKNISFQHIKDNVENLEIHYKELYEYILLYKKEDYIDNLKKGTEKIRKFIKSSDKHLALIPHKKVTKDIKKWVQLVNNTINVAMKWYPLFSGPDPDFKTRTVSAKQALYYSGEWYDTMMKQTKEYEKTTKEFENHPIFGAKELKTLKDLFHLMNKKEGMLDGVYYTIGAAIPGLKGLKYKVYLRKEILASWPKFKLK